MSRLTSVDLPTFGRPTTASTGAGGRPPPIGSAKSSGSRPSSAIAARSSCRALTSFSVARRDPRPARPVRPGWSRWPPPVRRGRRLPSASTAPPPARRPAGGTGAVSPAGRRVPRHTTGSTTAPPVRASQAAPCCAAATSPPVRVPSGNTATSPPPRSTDSACVSGRRSAVPRRTASWPMRGNAHPTGPWNISCFTRNTARRPSSPKSSGPSTNALWLATTTTGPCAGIRSRWWTRTR